MRLHAPNEYLHVFDRGMQKQPIFEIKADYIRFLFLILTFQGDAVIKNISREIKQSVQSSTLHIDAELEKDILKNRAVELISFCLVPNHFHLIVHELVEGGISKYMQRVMTAYTKYFNLRHGKSGHLFQGRYKSVLISNDRQLMHTSAYIHKHPVEIGWKGKEEKYPWSSYQDCIGENRFGSLLITDIIIKRFEEEKGSFSYKKFVSSSPAKEMTKELFS
ncbi:MAG: transposase [Candidatus Levyibacteriota bacterium]